MNLEDQKIKVDKNREFELHLKGLLDTSTNPDFRDIAINNIDEARELNPEITIKEFIRYLKELRKFNIES